jgi:hypothetical protein
MTILALVAALLVKHWICDFVIQTQYQVTNKGRYGHPGGILHAAIHGLGTGVCVAFVVPGSALIMAALDAVVHYHVDWAKSALNRVTGWTADRPQFWWLLGADQLLHHITYCIIVGQLLI